MRSDKITESKLDDTFDFISILASEKLKADSNFPQLSVSQQVIHRIEYCQDYGLTQDIKEVY